MELRATSGDLKKVRFVENTAISKEMEWKPKLELGREGKEQNYYTELWEKIHRLDNLYSMYIGIKLFSCVGGMLISLTYFVPIYQRWNTYKN